MKKLLTFILIVTIIATMATTVVACGCNKKSDTPSGASVYSRSGRDSSTNEPSKSVSTSQSVEDTSSAGDDSGNSQTGSSSGNSTNSSENSSTNSSTGGDSSSDAPVSSTEGPGDTEEDNFGWQ